MLGGQLWLSGFTLSRSVNDLLQYFRSLVARNGRQRASLSFSCGQFVYCRTQVFRDLGGVDQLTRPPPLTPPAILDVLVERGVRLSVELAVATTGRFHLSTDAYSTYELTVTWHLGQRVDYGQVSKVFGSPTTEEQRKYSPGKIIGTKRSAVIGLPERDRLCLAYPNYASFRIWNIPDFIDGLLGRLLSNGSNRLVAAWRAFDQTQSEVGVEFVLTTAAKATA